MITLSVHSGCYTITIPAGSHRGCYVCSDIGVKFERDAFDTLFDHAPDKLNVVKKVSVY